MVGKVGLPPPRSNGIQRAGVKRGPWRGSPAGVQVHPSQPVRLFTLNCSSEHLCF
jgi:hypothetical protein